MDPKKPKMDPKKENSSIKKSAMVVLGADRAITKSRGPKWRKKGKPGVITVCTGREGHTEKVQAIWQEDLKTDDVPDPEAFILVATEVAHMSSTQVRSLLDKLNSALEKEEKQAIARELVAEKMLSEVVVSYIVENENDLYLK